MDWESDDRGERQVDEIARALTRRRARSILATDPDREGEAISWHVQDMLASSGALKGVEVQRITFNEITKRAVQHAIAHPRDLDTPLIDAYLARRALDYLVGFTLSPVLWRKLPGQPLGRPGAVGGAAADLRAGSRDRGLPRPRVLDRRGRFTTPQGAPFTARLTHLDGKKLDQFDLPDEASADARQGGGRGRAASASPRSRSSRVKRNPPPPFTTSTLQQEASRKLGLGAQQTMRTAQQLYEGVESAARPSA